MTNKNGVILSAIHIRALDITDEEKRENEAKFKAWYTDYKNRYGVKHDGPKKCK